MIFLQINDFCISFYFLTNEKNYAKSSEKKEKINKDKNSSIYDNIDDAKNKNNSPQLQSIQSEQLLNIQKPISNDFELNKKVSNLIIDSIDAKLSLLNQMK